MRTFLSHVALSDFRTFGQFRLDVPPGPGLTLVVGPNGLGKSSFLDGIEWCLTGRVNRFVDYVGRRREGEYLTRRDAEEPDSHAVSLGFDRGTEFVRSRDAAPDGAKLLATLKAESWVGIKDLGAYLALTHFLGQGAQQRFTSRKGSDQWEALKGPSGIDRLEQVRMALRGAATTAAFRRRSTQQAAEVELAEEVLARWRDDAARLAQLRASALAAGASTEESIASDLDALATACAAIQPRAPVRWDRSDANGRLIALREEIARARGEVLTAQREVERLGPLVERFGVLAPAADPDGDLAAAVRRAVDEATAAATEASLAGRRVEREAAMAAMAAAAAAVALERSTALVAVVDELAEMAGTASGLAEQMAALAVPTTTADMSLAAATGALATARATHVTRRALEERRDEDVRLVERAGRLATLEWEWRNAQALAKRAQEVAITDGLAAERSRDVMDQLRIELNDAEAGLATARRKTSEVADALAIIAKHIGDHDRRCPVCATSFVPGKIRMLAEAAARAQDVDVMSRASELEALQRSMDDATTRVASADRSSMEAASARSSEHAIATSLEAARAEVTSLLNATPGDDLVAIADRRLTGTAAELAALEAEVARTGPTMAEIEGAVEEAERARASLSAERERIRRATAAAERRMTELGRALGSDPDAVGPEVLAARVAAGRRALEDADARHVAARVALASALSVEASARQRLDAADAARAQVDEAVSEARAERRELARAWTAAGLEGEPSNRVAVAHAAALATRLTELDGMVAEADRLAHAVREAAQASELAALEARMAASASSEGPMEASAYERVLLARLDDARAAIRATAATQQAVNAYTEGLKRKADSFSAEFLEPLNGLIDDFNRTLLGTPGETVQFNADAAVNRTAFGMRLRYADAVDNSRYDTGLAPQLVLSEGQMAANGFSILCAASVAYRWSNWRALLLDDPLQHNDVVHAAAFADVMRNLVEYEGYQLLMSSHDRGEGEFLFRKFDAAGLPCTMVMLTAPSRNGVLSEPPRRNAAASRLLATQLVAAG